MLRGAEQRLAAILVADVAGYSRLMGVDDAGTLAQFKVHCRTLPDPKIKGHSGLEVRNVNGVCAGLDPQRQNDNARSKVFTGTASRGKCRS